MDTIEILILTLAVIATLVLGGPRVQSLQELADRHCRAREPVQVAMVQAPSAAATRCAGGCPAR